MERDSDRETESEYRSNVYTIYFYHFILHLIYSCLVQPASAIVITTMLMSHGRDLLGYFSFLYLKKQKKSEVNQKATWTRPQRKSEISVYHQRYRRVWRPLQTQRCQIRSPKHPFTFMDNKIRKDLFLTPRFHRTLSAPWYGRNTANRADGKSIFDGGGHR